MNLQRKIDIDLQIINFQRNLIIGPSKSSNLPLYKTCNNKLNCFNNKKCDHSGLNVATI